MHLTVVEFRENSMPATYNVAQFANLSWDWNLMQQLKIVNPLYYYPKQLYINGKCQFLEDWQFSIITLPNLKNIPSDELFNKNIHSGNSAVQNEFINLLKNPMVWYDDKIDQVYKGINMIGRYPQDFGGIDIR